MVRDADQEPLVPSAEAFLRELESSFTPGVMPILEARLRDVQREVRSRLIAGLGPDSDAVVPASESKRAYLDGDFRRELAEALYWEGHEMSSGAEMAFTGGATEVARRVADRLAEKHTPSTGYKATDAAIKYWSSPRAEHVHDEHGLPIVEPYSESALNEVHERLHEGSESNE